MSIENVKQELINACYDDRCEDVKSLLGLNTKLNVNFVGSAAVGKRGNGTPLILIGCKEIAEILIIRGADVNYVYSPSEGHSGFTALDSARNTRDTKTGYKEGEEKYSQICELITYLESKGAKSAKEL